MMHNSKETYKVTKRTLSRKVTKYELPINMSPTSMASLVKLPMFVRRWWMYATNPQENDTVVHGGTLSVSMTTKIHNRARDVNHMNDKLRMSNPIHMRQRHTSLIHTYPLILGVILTLLLIITTTTTMSDKKTKSMPTLAHLV